jgi:BolA protein
MLKEKLELKIQKTFNPVYMEVVNESDMHNVPRGSESHFKVTIVSDEFDGKRLIARHRSVNALLAEELAMQIHALAIHTYTAEEWQQEKRISPDSPACAGGSNK